MKSAVVALNLLAAAAGLLAAVFWYRSSLVAYPPKVSVMTGWGGPGEADLGPLQTAVNEGARLNKLAARWSAASAILVALASSLSPFAEHSG